MADASSSVNGVINEEVRVDAETMADIPETIPVLEQGSQTEASVSGIESASGPAENDPTPILPAVSSLRDGPSMDEAEVNREVAEKLAESTPKADEPVFSMPQLSQLVAIIDNAMDRGATRAKILQKTMEESIQYSLSTVSSFALSTALAPSTDANDNLGSAQKTNE